MRADPSWSRLQVRLETRRQKLAQLHRACGPDGQAMGGLLDASRLVFRRGGGGARELPQVAARSGVRTARSRRQVASALGLALPKSFPARLAGVERVRPWPPR